MLGKVFIFIKHCLFMVLILMSVAVSANSPSLQLYYEQFPPYNFKQDGAMLGINAEIVQVICMKAELQC